MLAEYHASLAQCALLTFLFRSQKTHATRYQRIILKLSTHFGIGFLQRVIRISANAFHIGNGPKPTRVPECVCAVVARLSSVHCVWSCAHRAAALSLDYIDIICARIAESLHCHVCWIMLMKLDANAQCVYMPYAAARDREGERLSAHNQQYMPYTLAMRSLIMQWVGLVSCAMKISRLTGDNDMHSVTRYQTFLFALTLFMIIFGIKLRAESALATRNSFSHSLHVSGGN